MAGRTADTFLHVNAVIEVHETGHVVDPVPRDWLASEKALAHRLQRRTLRPDLRVTVHTRLRRRHTGKTAGFHGGMAVTAIDAIVGHMVLVTERDGLVDRLFCRRDVWRANVQLERAKQYRQSNQGTNQTDAREGVRAWSEALRHA